MHGYSTTSVFLFSPRRQIFPPSQERNVHSARCVKRTMHHRFWCVSRTLQEFTTSRRSASAERTRRASNDSPPYEFDVSPPAALPHASAGIPAKVLLTSVFGPYACDDDYGSRVMNPMELYHNQVTRMEGPFSLRMFHRSWGLMLIQANIEAPCTLLDFPTLDRFTEEIRDHRYDVVGISSIIPNCSK